MLRGAGRPHCHTPGPLEWACPPLPRALRGPLSPGARRRRLASLGEGEAKGRQDLHCFTFYKMFFMMMYKLTR